ncbi:MAG: hypothetical protein KDE27_00805 [Planctomycetes bacterium]|nr:hypothetical protein [Planctomycetota bacterium]
MIAASRDFVCARLLTYESAAEAKVLLGVFRGRDGLENSTFAILDPSGREQLVRSGRSPSWAFDDAAAMAAAMQRIAQRYPGREDAEPIGLPRCADVRRGLGVAAADQLQLAIVTGDGAARARLEARLAELAWSDDLIGRLVYARADADTDWSAIAGGADRPAAGLVIVRPGEFGVDGQVVAIVEDGELDARELLAAVKAWAPGPVDTARLRARGARAGIEWQTAIPVSDRRGPDRDVDRGRRRR